MTENIQSQNLKSLLVSDAWKIIEQDLKEEIDRLTSEILGESGINAEDNVVKYNNTDMMKIQRLMNKSFLMLPETLIDKLSPVEEIKADI